MSKTLVAFFSASGITERLARNLASAIGADVCEIAPKLPYTKEDLDWTDPDSRSSREMKDKKYRPALEESALPATLEEYDQIFIGFPIWWYVAPTVVNTFLERYDLNGKTIVPFATSGGSGMGRTNDDLAPSCPGAILKPGKRFAAAAAVSELKIWAQNL